MRTVWQNLRYTIRVLRGNLGFTTVAVLSLALGIGANTAIFSLVNALLLRNLSVREPQNLVELSAVRRDGKIPFSYPMFREVERGQRVFSGLIGWSAGGMFNVEVNGVISQHHVRAVTGNYYSELGVSPFLGRLITVEDVNPRGSTTSQIAVLGYEFWHRHFGAASDVIGKEIRIEGRPFTIVGITRKWFTGMTTGEPPEVTIPLTAQPLIQGNDFKIDDRSILWMFVTGRLKDGVTIRQVRAQLLSFWPDVLAATASTEAPGQRRQTFLSMGLDVTSAATGVDTDLRSQFMHPLYLLLGIVGLILLVACVNLANLMLARGAARSHEMSVRVALGANRWLLARQVLTESLALSFAGALLGLAFAYWGSHLLVTLMTQEYLTPVVLDLRPDLRVLSVTVSLGILTGILFGIAPALRSSRQAPAFVLQQNARSLTAGTGRLGKALIVAQVALSLILLSGAGLLVRSFQRLHSVNLGFEKDGLLEVSLNPTPAGYQNLDMNAYHSQLVEHISMIWGVRSVAFSDGFIPNPDGWRDTVSPMSSDSVTDGNLMANAAMISPDFFRTLGIQLVRGRDFDWNDDERHSPVAIISSSLGERLFPDGHAMGQHIRFSVMPDLQALEIVGVAGNARVFDLRDAAAYVIYLPCLQHPKWTQWGGLFVRTNVAPDALARTVTHEVESLGHEYALGTKTVAQVTGQVLVPERVTAALSSFFAALALLLASVGIYGLTSYAVIHRTREIGIRVAVGAQQWNVLWIVLRETLVLVLVGIAIGIPCALGAGRLIATMLFGLSPNDLPTIAGVSLLLLVVGLFAGSLPARRASVIDPVVALRTE